MKHVHDPSSGRRVAALGFDTEHFWPNERYVAALLEGMQEGVVIQDAGSGILAANHAAEELLGLSLEQMSGQSSLDPLWQAVHPDGAPLAWHRPSQRALSEHRRASAEPDHGRTVKRRAALAEDQRHTGQGKFRTRTGRR